MARATIDKWKTKKSFDIVAPNLFNNKVIGQTFSASSKTILGRIIKASYADVSGSNNPRLQRIKLKFRIESVSGERAITKFIGYEISQDYERSLVRRRTSKIYINKKVTTKDNQNLRVKAIAVTIKKLNNSTLRDLNLKFSEFLENEAKTQNFSDFLNNVLTNKINLRSKKALINIYPLRHAVIQKIEVL